MRFSPALFVAARNLLGRKAAEDGTGSKHRLTGAILGVALSIVPLTVVLFVADGMIEGITSRYLETSTYHLQASPFYSISRDELESASARIAALPGVTGAFPEMQGPAVMLAAAAREGEAQPQPTGATVRAIEPALLDDPGFRKFMELKSGELAFKRGNDVILGSALAARLHAGVGDLVSMITVREGGIATFSPRLSTLRVRGIVSSGYQELDALWAIVSITSGEKMLEPGTRRVFIGIKTDAAFRDLSAKREGLAGLLAGDAAAELPWTVRDWREIEGNLWRSFSTTKALLVLIMALAVAVAAVNVGASLIMLALERKKDIAILKSTGTRDEQVSAIFVASGAFIGASGSLLGLAIGSLISVFVNQLIAAVEWILNLFASLVAWIKGAPIPAHLKLLDPSFYLESIPVHISFPELALIALGSILLCILASLYPAHRASKLPPMEIFRKS
jgi:lipoprotein-releasing system permease protein